MCIRDSNRVDCDVAVLNAKPGFDLKRVARVLVPTGGGGRQHELRARLLGTLHRGGRRKIEYLRVLPSDTSDDRLREAERALERLAHEEAGGRTDVRAIRSDGPVDAVVTAAQGFDLVVLGLPRVGGKALFGQFAIDVARGAPCATIMLSHGR